MPRPRLRTWAKWASTLATALFSAITLATVFWAFNWQTTNWRRDDGFWIMHGEIGLHVGIEPFPWDPASPIARSGPAPLSTGIYSARLLPGPWPWLPSIHDPLDGGPKFLRIPLTWIAAPLALTS